MGFKVIIVGGGLAGALLGQGLLNNNVDFTIYERDIENSKHEGYQIRVGDEAMRGFDACLKAKHIEEIQSKFGQSERATQTAPSIYSSKFRLLLDLTKFPSYSKSAAINRVVLRDALLEEVAHSGRIQYNRAFKDYEIIQNEEGQDVVRVNFSDNSSAICDLLIGADGSGSKINRQLGLKNLVPIDTHLSFLCKGTLSHKLVQQMPRNLQRGPMLVFSKGATLFFALYMPSAKSISEGTEASTVDFEESASSFYWAISIPKSQVAIKDLSEITDPRQFCLDYIKNWSPEYKTMLCAGQSNEDGGQVVGIQFRASTKPRKGWRNKAKAESKNGGHPRVWLIGDAIHAMLPNRGMGGNQAMRDCADILPEILKLNEQAEFGSSPSTEQVRAACDTYEGAMIDRAFVWVQKSGGSSMPMLNLDGVLGHILFIVGKIVALLVEFYTKLVK